MPTNIDQKELYSLIRESVKANTTNAQTTKSMAKVTRELKKSMCQMNDNFVLHNLTQNNIGTEVTIIKKQLLKWMMICVIIIFTLLGGIIIAKALGLDVIELINS